MKRMASPRAFHEFAISEAKALLRGEVPEYASTGEIVRNIWIDIFDKSIAPLQRKESSDVVRGIFDSISRNDVIAQLPAWHGKEIRKEERLHDAWGGAQVRRPCQVYRKGAARRCKGADEPRFNTLEIACYMNMEKDFTLDISPPSISAMPHEAAASVSPDSTASSMRRTFFAEMMR